MRLILWCNWIAHRATDPKDRKVIGGSNPLRITKFLMCVVMYRFYDFLYISGRTRIDFEVL